MFLLSTRFIAIALYLFAPRTAYNFMQLVEEHAHHTYDTFVREHEAELKTQPAPEVAINYYRDGDLYMFDEFQTGTISETRRPVVDNLYDVFVNIRDDEGEHVKTMVACQKPEAKDIFKSPHTPDRREVDVVLPPITDRAG